MVQKGKEVRNYYRQDGFLFVADHVTKTVTVPQSFDEGTNGENYPPEVYEHIKNDKYYVQLTIE